MSNSVSEAERVHIERGEKTSNQGRCKNNPTPRCRRASVFETERRRLLAATTEKSATVNQ